jgi:hypothetical protein
LSGLLYWDGAGVSGLRLLRDHYSRSRLAASEADDTPLSTYEDADRQCRTHQSGLKFTGRIAVLPKFPIRAPMNRSTGTNLPNNLACIHTAEYSICELKKVPMTKRAAIYVRMSTEHQQYSIVNQEDAIERYAAEHKLSIVRKFIDSGKSITGQSMPSRA